MDAPLQIVLSSATAIVGALAAAVVFLFRELSRKSDEAAQRIKFLESKIDSERERYEQELDEERTARREAAEQLAKTSVDIINKGSAVVDVLTRRAGARRDER